MAQKDSLQPGYLSINWTSTNGVTFLVNSAWARQFHFVYRHPYAFIFISVLRHWKHRLGMIMHKFMSSKKAAKYTSVACCHAATAQLWNLYSVLKSCALLALSYFPQCHLPQSELMRLFHVKCLELTCRQLWWLAVSASGFSCGLFVSCHRGEWREKGAREWDQE